jgi:hypothetical protein
MNDMLPAPYEADPSAQLQVLFNVFEHNRHENPTRQSDRPWYACRLGLGCVNDHHLSRQRASTMDHPSGSALSERPAVDFPDVAEHAVGDPAGLVGSAALGGMDRIYRTHKWAGILAISFAAMHWLIELSGDILKSTVGRVSAACRRKNSSACSKSCAIWPKTWANGRSMRC